MARRSLAGIAAALGAAATVAAALPGASPSAVPLAQISVLQPRTGVALAGTVQIAVRVRSLHGVATVGVRIDGRPSARVRTLPRRGDLYRFAWNSRSVVNGRHSVTATTAAWTSRARKVRRVTTSRAVAVVVRNPGRSTIRYPVHTNITATVFWIGEPKGKGSSEDNAVSAYDDAWEKHYGGYDDYRVTRVPPTYSNGLGFTPGENPFYLDLPYDDVNNAHAFAARWSVVPWAAQYASKQAEGSAFSLMKNRWVKLWRTVGGTTYTAYGQIEDAGPYEYDDAAYVFGSDDARPASQQANNAGMDVSPALRDYLHFTGVDLADQQNGDSNKVSWQFVDDGEVPPGPWKDTVTTRQVYQP